MAGLDPAIHASLCLPQSVDQRVKPAGDEDGVWLALRVAHVIAV